MLLGKMPTSTQLLHSIGANSIILLVATILVGCGGLAGSESEKLPPTVPTTPIASLMKLPKRDSTVYLKGKVGDRVPLLGGTVYKLQDPTGEIWVLTQKQPPNAGEEVMVKGTLRFQSISINNQEQGSVYVEQE